MTNSYYELWPEVPVAIGPGTIINREKVPFEYDNLHLIFQGWLGDELIQGPHIYAVTENLLEAIKSAKLSGFRDQNVEVSYSYEFRQRYPDRVMPNFKRLLVIGKQGDDYFLNSRHNLVVSEFALEVMQNSGRLINCEINPFVEF